MGQGFAQLINGSLAISSITKEAEGLYTCKAQNGVRNDISKTINVSVNGESTSLNFVT